MPISSMAQAKTGFHSVTSSFRRHFRATVFGGSKTHSSRTPPDYQDARPGCAPSSLPSFTTLTRMNREYFRREAKTWIRRVDPSRKATSTCPKSCWLNSPGRPSKRIGGFVSFGRSEATRAYKAVLSPEQPAPELGEESPARAGRIFLAESLPRKHFR